MKKLPLVILSATLSLGLSALSMSSHAADTDEHPALAACKDKKAHNNCSFTTKNNKTMNGSCEARPQHADELVCHPKKQGG